MTTEELRAKFNNEFGFSTPWAKTYEVDHETYANVIQDILDQKVRIGDVYRLGNEEIGQFYRFNIDTGVEHNGILFKGVELILKSREIMK